MKSSFVVNRLAVCGRNVVMAWALTLVAACGSIGTNFSTESEIVSYQHRTRDSYVRIERAERSAAENAHPATITTASIRRILSGLRVKGGVSSDAMPVFTAEELDELASPLAAALAKARANEDVTFGVSGLRGFLGSYSPRSLSTGRVFVRDAKFNLVFGRVHEPYARDSLGSSGRDDWTPGSRLRSLETVATIVPGDDGKLVQRRTDWVIVDLTAMPAPTPEARKESAPATPNVPVTPSTADPDRRADEVGRRMRVLDRLREQGAISEDEYRERRRAILLEI